MDIQKITGFLLSQNQPGYRLRQIKQFVFEKTVGDWGKVTVLPLRLRQELDKEIPWFSFSVERVLVSQDKSVYKAVLRLKDQSRIETVLIGQPGYWSSCLSTQVGCALGCRFCATGQMGFKRNLTTEEITDQLLFWKQYLRENRLPDNLTHVVFMGMGEPLANQKSLFASLKIINDPDCFGIGQRRISVSTSGLVGGILELAKSFPQINLAVSLHAPTDQLRSQLLPGNQKRPLKFLIEDLRQYFKISRRQVFLEYILFKGLNDQSVHGRQLIGLINQIGNKSLLHLNLIPYNPTGGVYQPSLRKEMERFKNYLESLGLQVTIRKSSGQDIMAACGQLATGNN